MFVDNTRSCVSQQSPESGCSPVTVTSLPSTLVTTPTGDDHTTTDTITTSAIPTTTTTVPPTQPADTCSPRGPSLVAKCQSMYKICYNGNTTHQVHYVYKCLK